ncbi:MAG TPA: hypothetical protein VH394_04630 [Thermoanaerobaculia bacterium]|nr:hypothetical protein [Thermoanaerobaculia bacterium]
MRRAMAALVCAWCVLLIPPMLAGQQVKMPLSDYNQLRARANPDQDADPPPPAPYAFESADLAITAGPESARIVQTLDLSLFADGWQAIPLGEAGSFIEARFGDLEGRVNVDEKGWALQVRGRGRHRVTLESVVPVKRDETATRPTWQVGLRLPPAAVVRGRIEAPATVEEVEIEGAGLVRRDGSAWAFVAAPTPEPVGFTLRGRRTLPERAQLPLRFETTAATAAVLSRTRLQVYGSIEARVAQGRLSELKVPLPAGFEVVSVQGPIAGWKVDAGRLVVTPLEPVETSLAVEVELSAPPSDELTSPLLVPADSHRTLLLTKAALRGDGLLELTDPGAVRATSETETTGISDDVRGAPGALVAVLDPARPPRWRAEWADRTQVLAAQVDRLLVNVVVGESGRAAYQVWAEVRNRGSQQLVVTPPAGFELVAGHRDGERVSPGAAGASLAVPLSSGEAAQVVHLAGLMPLQVPKGKGDFSLPLPALSAPAARVEVRLILPGGRSYTIADPSRSGTAQPPPGQAERAARRDAVVNANNIAKQVLDMPGAVIGTSAAGLFPEPPGFRRIDAVWSALSATPGPLAVRVESEKEDNAWF